MTAENHTVTRPQQKTRLPGPKARALLERDARFISPSYTRGYPLVIARGRGLWVEDVDGNTFLDFTAGIAVNATGHCHPDVVAAIREQAGEFLHMSGTDFYYEPQIALAERLSRLVPGHGDKKTFFSNSGAEAIECALKLARFATGRQLFIAFEGAFHGRTFGSMSVSASKTVHKRGFHPLVPGVHHVPFGDHAAVERLLERTVPAEDVAAIIVEPIQGEGGYVIPPDGFLPALRGICDRHGMLLVVDEVQSGMGRTGKMFACEHWGVVPDILAAAKGIASGMPLGVTVAPGAVMRWGPGAHANTFGGNPLSCRAALKTIDLLEGGLVANAAAAGARMLAGMRRIRADHAAAVVDARGKGLMLALELRSSADRDAVVEKAFHQGLLLLGAGRSAVRLCPSLTITEDEADVGLEILAAAVREVAK
jgi:4-aminobutyrate aminotransferase